MALDTYRDLWGRVLLRCPLISPKLAQDQIVNAFRQVAERRRWSWLIKYGQFLVPAVYNTGTVSVTRASTTVTGVGTTFTSDMVGRQFRITTSSPIYTIASFTSTTSIELDSTYGGASTSAIGFQIYQCYFTAPSDFHSFLSVWDPAMNWQLWLNAQQQELNTWDAQRSNTGQAFCVASLDYSTSRVGIVSSVTQVVGTGPDPTSGGSYTAPSDGLFTVEITLGGGSGVATYKWKKGDGAYTTGVLTSTAAATLRDGVTVAFPTATYVIGDVFVIQGTATSAPGLPRYEIWPHQTAQYVYPFLYEARATDLNDANAVLPRYIRGDVLVEMALAQVARWPGPSVDKPNPYFNANLAQMHEMRAEKMILIMERQDDEVFQADLSYQQALGFSYASPLGDAAWLQSHSI